MQYDCKCNKYFNTKKHLIDIFAVKLAFCLKIFISNVILHRPTKSVRTQKTEGNAIVSIVSGSVSLYM